MLLKKLIENIPKDKKNKLFPDCQQIVKSKKNYIFFAIKGNKDNGEDFIDDAIDRGASVIVCSKSCNFERQRYFCNQNKKDKKLLSKITSRFYKNKPNNIIAVTGTNGKTCGRFFSNYLD